MTATDAATPYEARSSARYIDTFAGFTEDEVRTLCEVKRFLECNEGDRSFRASVEAGGAFTNEQREMLREIGIRFPPEAMALIWTAPGVLVRLRQLTYQTERFEDLPADIHDTLAGFPEMRIWQVWAFRRARMGMAQKRMVLTTPTASPAYTAWRSRRIAAVRNELGTYGWDIDHPCHAVELAVGCSVGCGFCAFDAGKLQTLFDYDAPGNRELLRGVARGMVRVLGWPSAHGMLYWSTEPADNPAYVRILEDWQDITSATLCTATARADADWVAALQGFYTRSNAPWPRISVLSRNIMRKLHRTFTPRQMRDTSLLMQQSDAEFMREKVPGGRAKMLQRLIESDDLRRINPDDDATGLDIPQGSIACISGPLVNMVNRTIRLISPCYTSAEHPYGYRVYDQIAFDGPEDFAAKLALMVERSMVKEPYAEMPVKWRDDLKFTPREDGFTLQSRTVQRDFRKGAAHQAVGALVAAGQHSWGNIVEALADDPEVGPFAALAVLGALFDRGYLCELAISADHRARHAATRPVAALPA
jgi:radical SAM family RiPP maturation amino acid epimerase